MAATRFFVAAIATCILLAAVRRAGSTPTVDTTKALTALCLAMSLLWHKLSHWKMPPADADCIGSGLSIRNTCAAFISSVKSQTSNINNLDCGSIRSNINSGQYGTPSSA